MSHFPRVPVVAVVGGRTASDALLREAHALGQGLMDAGLRLATGGRDGIMEAASKGARSSRGWREGRVLAVLPGLDAAEANPYADVIIPTGMNHARNVILVAMADVVVAVGGGAGTLSEIAMAWTHDKPIVALDRGEGWSSELAGRVLDGRRVAPIRRATDATQALDHVAALLGR